MTPVASSVLGRVRLRAPPSPRAQQPPNKSHHEAERPRKEDAQQRALIGVRCKEKGTDETCKKRDGTDEQRETYRAFPLPPATAQRAVTNHCPKGNKGYHREKERENGAHASVPWTVAAGALSLRTTCERSDASHGSAPAACARPLPPAQGPRVRKVRGEFSLTVLASNLKRVLNLVSVARLLEVLA